MWVKKFYRKVKTVTGSSHMQGHFIFGSIRYVPPYKEPINLHSFRLFCSGVPVSTIRRNVVILFIALDNAVSSFFNMWPSSHTTRSGPENGYNYKYNTTITKVTIPSQYHTCHVPCTFFYLILVDKQDCKSLLCTLSRRLMHDMVTYMLVNNKLRGLSPREDYTDRAAAAGRRS
jgi:hypothetical protein